ncbi:MAG: 4-(cytidine 5'-diphospho)-2-C-methyl-D-erythritol kinase [Actinomycetota bacterium]|nr:4-(cytidine 5'-diphospho)-2-C-methyl-D-erythritol kinase [Chloroflexota bacterium]MDP9069378.1 4-(cytidine 5'-diphospho)-2-C-methyl-D-erythritol kinase [Actinomycetota bacterium]
MAATRELRLRTGAKLNLFLRVVGRRPDGYHELESIFQSLDFGDDLQVAEAPDDEITVAMHSEVVVGLPSQEQNLAYIAARRLQEATSTRRGARVQIDKRIPLGGGLGGGSSNAAGVLLALDQLWKLGLERRRMLELAAEIGSDVPYCLGGGATCLVTGRGEKLAPLPPPPRPLWFVLGMSDEPLATATVYAGLGELTEHRPAVAPVTMALGAGDVAELGELLHNDLEPVALRLRPELRERKDALRAAGAVGVALSGSGPTLFGLAGDEAGAHAIAERVLGAFDRVVVTSSSSGCVGSA